MDTTDNLAEVDAPEISILQVQDSPIAQKTQTPLKIKLKVKEPVKDTNSPGSRAGHDSDAVDEDDEEDQLIDDNDEAVSVPAKRKAPATTTKRKPKKKLAADKPPQSPAPTLSEPASVHSTPPKKDKETTPKKKKPPPKIKLSAVRADDAMSEGHGTVTASSPVTAHHSPEPEVPAEQPAPPAIEDMNLEGVPIPVYPLPTKPFPVMPPVKIPTGFNTPMPLDKTGAKVRPWRMAHREIRGIAGGRFFARCWVGSRDSDYASAKASAEAEKPPTSVSVPLNKSRSKGTKGANPLPNVPSLAPSRSSSTVPELNTSASAPLTKMRNMIEAETLSQDAEVASEA